MKAILSAALAVMVALSAMDAGAQDRSADRKVELAIEQQSLADALNEWAKQTGLQLVSSSSEMMNTTLAPTLKGEYTPKRALEELLKGTSLTYEWVSERAVAIREKSLVLPAALQPGEQAVPKRALPISRLTGEAPESREQAPSNQSSARRPTSEDAPTDQNRVEISEEIVVTGTHIRGLSNETIPTVVLTKSDIDATGVSTAAKLLESVPQNFALTSQSGLLVPGVSSSREQGASINLRGIGEGTTLVLLNGRRIAPGFLGAAADISAIPVSALERVEILTDGASALYGSDAIGGAVNFILRHDFDGAETRLRTGWADGIDEYRASQALGRSWDSGNALVSLEYYKRDLLTADERDFVPTDSLVGSLYPKDENYSGVFSGRQSLGESVDVFADALYTKRDSFNKAGITTFNETFDTSNVQWSATLGTNLQLGKNWQAEVSANYARNKLNQVQDSLQNAGLGQFVVDTLFEIKSAEAKFDGALMHLSGGDVRAAVGVDWRSEKAIQGSRFTEFPFSSVGEFDQTVRSIFGELHVPIVGSDDSLAAVHRLTLSLAARYDDYSNFGSSLDPQVGIAWEPSQSIRLRVRYGTSYKAPKLPDYDLTFNNAIAFYLPDANGPGGISHLLRITGNSDSYSAQESTNTSIGLQFTPVLRPGLTVGLNYYNIDYEDRIAPPPSEDIVLGTPSAYGELIVRDPSADQVAQYTAIGALGGRPLRAFNPDFTPDLAFDPSSVDVILDLRRRNLSVLETSGFDVSCRYRFDTGVGRLAFGLDGTYILKFEQRVTPASAAVESVGTIYNPPDYRLRGAFQWVHGGWSSNLFINHAASYVDNRVAAAPVAVASYTTVDARLAYDFSSHFSSGFLAGAVLSLSAQNLLDRRPPAVQVISPDRDLGFDPTNADPLGRLVALELVKSW